MSTRLTFASVKSAIARVLGQNTTDARVAEYTSRAQELLLYKGKWVGTYGRYRVCIQDNCLTWPREIETIEMAALCDVPITVRDGWYEFLGAGPGIQSDANCGCANQLIDRGDAVAFDDVKGEDKKLAIYCDGTETGSILVRYYDSNGNKVYSTVSGETIEGEYLTFAAAGNYVYSTYEVWPGGFYGVVKPETNRMVRVYEYDTVALTYRPLAYYEPDETNPVYRRSLVPGISGSCDGDGEDCATKTIDIVGKFRNRPVTKDSDALIIQSQEALRVMVQAIRKQENNLWDDAARYEARAESILNDQLKHWLGEGKVSPMRIIGSSTFGAADLTCLIMGLLSSIGKMVGLGGDNPDKLNLIDIDPTRVQGQAISGNLANLGQTEKFADLVNKFSSEQLNAMLEKAIPGYSGLRDKSTETIASFLRGEIPKDVERQLEQRAAEKGVSLGTSGSEFQKFDTLRNLGLTSLQITQQGLDSASKWIASVPRAPTFDFTSMFFTPQQRLSFELGQAQTNLPIRKFNNWVDAMPSNFERGAMGLLEFGDSIVDAGIGFFGSGMLGGMGGGGSAKANPGPGSGGGYLPDFYERGPQ